MGYDYFNFGRLTQFEIDDLICSYNERHKSSKNKEDDEKEKLIDDYKEQYFKKIQDKNIEKNGSTNKS